MNSGIKLSSLNIAVTIPTIPSAALTFLMVTRQRRPLLCLAVSHHKPSCAPVAASQPATAQTPGHRAPRSWHERDFCLMNLPTSRSRW